MTSPILKNLWTGHRFWPDFCLDFAWNFEDFESADKIGVCKSGFRSSRNHLLTFPFYFKANHYHLTPGSGIATTLLKSTLHQQCGPWTPVLNGNMTTHWWETVDQTKGNPPIVYWHSFSKFNQVCVIFYQYFFPFLKHKKSMFSIQTLKRVVRFCCRSQKELIWHCEI